MKTLKELLETPNVRKAAIDEISLYQNSRIVEIGSTRAHSEKYGYLGDGWITFILLQMAVDTDSILYSVDIDPYTSWSIDKIFQSAYNSAWAYNQDGVQFLKEVDEPIHLLVLDAWDVGTPNYKEHHLEAWQAAKYKMAERSYVVIDDVFPIDGLGKGELVLPELIQEGYKYVVQGYTCVLKRGEDEDR